MGGMDWFKLWDEAKEDPKLQTLTDAQHRVWFNLLCLSNRGEPRGRIEPMSERMLALEVARRNTKLLARTLDALAALEIIEVEDDGAITFLKWEKRQGASRKPSDSPERVRERVKRHRERSKQPSGAARNSDPKPQETPAQALPMDCNACNAPCNDCNACNDTEGERDSELERDLESSPPYNPPPPTETVYEAAARLPGLRPEAMKVMAALEQGACELLDRRELTKAQQRAVRAFVGEMNGSLSPDVVEASVVGAASHRGGDQLAYLFQVIRNRAAGVGKVPANGHGPPAQSGENPGVGEQRQEQKKGVMEKNSEFIKNLYRDAGQGNRVEGAGGPRLLGSTPEPT